MTATAYPLRRAQTANSTSTSFTNKTPTATKPTGTGVVDIFDRDLGLAASNYVPQYLQLQPFGTDADNETFDMRLWGWSKIANPGETDHGVWLPTLLLDLSCTLGNIAATALGTNHFLVDTIVVNAGDADVALISTADDTASSILVHTRASELLGFDFDLTGAAAANCLWRTIDHP